MGTGLEVGLDAVLRAQQRGCAIGGSALYAGLLDEVKADVADGGPCRAVLEGFADEPWADALVLRFLAAVHELVLDGSAPELAPHYPSVGGTPGDGIGGALVRTVENHRERVVERTAAPIQTNEVGRSAALLGGYLALAADGRPLRVLEVGASAGLNLRFDQFRYEAGAAAFGPVASEVRFVEPWTGCPPRLDTAIEVVERRGCDTRPLDPGSARDQMRLRACVWPDQPERRRRLDGALAIAARVPAPLDRADATTWIAAQLATSVPGVTTVVVHSIVAQYLTAERRRGLENTIAEAGTRATADAPVAWLRMEPASAEEAEVRLTRWPAPSSGSASTVAEVRAHSGFHGPPVRWHG